MITIFGFIFISNINTVIKKSDFNNTPFQNTPFTSHIDKNYSISFPENYQIYIDKIVATEGIVNEEENTIHLISPTLPGSNGNLSIIFSYEKFTTFQKEADSGSTCAELYGKELEKIQIGENIFTTSGQIFCGPNEVAFFYVINGENMYEAKVETTANYETEALPEILKILKTLKFNS